MLFFAWDGAQQSMQAALALLFPTLAGFAAPAGGLDQKSSNPAGCWPVCPGQHAFFQGVYRRLIL